MVGRIIPTAQIHRLLSSSLKKDLTITQREIAKLKNPLHQAKENIAKECAESCSKSKKDDSPEDEVGTNRDLQ
jgi:hypothetical protein